MSIQESCRDFRLRLESVLEGNTLPDELLQLSWHEHLLGCTDCRDLLERENALEQLLASLPEPSLSPDLARRVLAQLKAQSRRLDLLLDCDGGTDSPNGLADRVLAGLANERGVSAVDPLDRLLALDNEVEVPAGLAARVLADLRPSTEREVTRPFHLRLLRSPAFYAAAAALILFFTSPLWRSDHNTDPEPRRLVATSNEEKDIAPDEELLAFFDVLDRDELWNDDLSMEAVLAVSLSEEDEAVLGYEDTDEEGLLPEETEDDFFEDSDSGENG